MSIKCGNHQEKTYHETVAQVRACFAGATGSEPTFNEVIVTDAELQKVVDGVREMEQDGILPRRSRPYGIEDARRELAGERQPREHGLTSPEGLVEALTRAAGSARKPAVRLSAKGREMPAEFGGSPKQYDFIFELTEQLGQAGDDRDWAITTVKAASQEIGRLQPLVRAARSERQHNDGAVPTTRQTVTGQVTEDGIYRNPATGEIFKVQVAVHGSGHLYAKQAVVETVDGDNTRIPLAAEDLDEHEVPAEMRIEWVYKAGLLGKIKPEWKVTREEAVAFGALYGCCIRCGRTLTNEESIEAAIGPVCRGKLGF